MLLHLCQVTCEVCNSLDTTDLLPIHLLCVPRKALEHAPPCPGPAVQDYGHVGLRALHIESVHKHLRRFDLCRPARFAETSTAINEQNNVKLFVTSHREIARRELAPFHVALLVLQPFQRPRAWTFASALGNCLDKLLALPSAPITVFGACAPLSPSCEPAILLACLVVARSRLRSSSTGISPILHGSLHLTQALCHATTTLCTAFAPSTPSGQLAINWAWQIIATPHCCQWQTLCAPVRVSENITREFLLTRTFLATGAHPCALLWIPLGDLTVLKESRVPTSLHLIELSTDFLQRADFSLEVDIVATACFHLLYQILVQLGILICSLTGSLSSCGFLLSCTCQFCLGIAEHVLIILNLSLQGILSLLTELLEHVDVLEKLIPFIFNARLDEQEPFLQFVALWRLLDGALSSAFVLRRRSTSPRVLTRIARYLGPWQWRVAELGFVDHG